MVGTGAASPRLVFVMSPWQNAFFRELSEVLVDEVTRAGVDAVVTTEPGDFAVGGDDVFVLMPPHEFVTLEGSGMVDDPVVAARTIGISAEQPHQVFFASNAAIGERLGAVIDFSAMAVAAYRERGVDAAHMPFGYTPSWDRFDASQVPSGPPRVLYFGNKKPRRLEVLAEHADVLARQSARLLVSDNSSPNMVSGPTFLVGDDKRALLASTRLLVNIHQGDEPYFEWLRFCEAAMAGAAYLTERSEHCEPWLAGEQFAVFDRSDMGRAIEALVDDGAELGRLRQAAYDAVRSRPLADSVHVLVEAAERLRSSAPAPAALPARTRREPLVGERPAVVPGSLASRLERRRGLGRFLRRRRGGASASVSIGAGWSQRDLPDGDVLLMPEGTTFIANGLERLVSARRDSGADLSTGVTVASTPDGRVILEGVWPWETWRLLDGQDLGTVMVVSATAWAAAMPWLTHPDWTTRPHLAVAMSVADRGGHGAHVPTPVAASATR